jgi:hypothetical protein
MNALQYYSEGHINYQLTTYLYLQEKKRRQKSAYVVSMFVRDKWLRTAPNYTTSTSYTQADKSNQPRAEEFLQS